jgi:hypothetical protein
MRISNPNLSSSQETVLSEGNHEFIGVFGVSECERVRSGKFITHWATLASASTQIGQG